MTLESDCSWDEHITAITSKARKTMNILRKLKTELDRKSLESLYYSQVRPILEYADCVWLNCNIQDKERLESVQLEALRIITGAPRGTSHALLYEETGIEPLEKRRTDHQLTMYYKINRQAPQYLYLNVPYREQPHNLRNKEDIPVSYTRTVSYKNPFFPSAVRRWNQLDPAIRNSPTLSSFKSRLKANRKRPPPHYYIGKMIHSNLRMESSNIQFHMFTRYLTEDPGCECGAPVQ